jgi:hypothetical protein
MGGWQRQLGGRRRGAAPIFEHDNESPLCYPIFPAFPKYTMSIVRIPSSDQQLPPYAVIVTVCSGSSYDDLYNERPQISPDPSRCIAVYRTDYESLPAILRALQQPDDAQDGASAVLRSLVADVATVTAESPSGVVFNFECCSAAGSHGFSHCGAHIAPVCPATASAAPSSGAGGIVGSIAGWFGAFGGILSSTSSSAAPDVQSPAAALKEHDTRRDIMLTVAHALGCGFMVIFGDFSLKALIHDWDHSLLGPLPFEQVGTVSGSVRLRFQREHLMACPSAQLQCVGQLCSDNFAGVHAQSDTIQFVVKHDRPATDEYQLQILTVVEAAAGYRGAIVELGQYKGTAGHVLLKYRSGGMMLVSATHWMELTNVNADEADVAQVLLQRQGEFAAAQFQEELESCKTAADRKACSARKAVALVQLTSPSPSIFNCNSNPSAPV